MSLNQSSVFRTVLLGVGCAALVGSVMLLFQQQLVAGFLLAFAGLSAISAQQTSIDYATRYTARSFLSSMGTGRTHQSTLGMVCNIVSYFCLVAALTSWVALR